MGKCSQCPHNWVAQDLLLLGAILLTAQCSVPVGSPALWIGLATPYANRPHGRTPIRQPVDVLQLPWVTITQLAHPEKLRLVHKSSKQRISLDVQ